jgi:hypothetical protein
MPRSASMRRSSSAHAIVVRNDNKETRMDGNPRSTRRRVVGASGWIVGALAGVLTVVFAGGAVAQQVIPATPLPLLEASHLPPLLTAPGEHVELRYDVYCGNPDDPDVPCDADGSAFVRVGDVGPYREILLREDPQAVVGRFVATLPSVPGRAGLGFSYYAVVRSKESGKTLTLPAGGADAPQRSFPLRQSIDVALGQHEFGSVRRATARVAAAAWGNGPGEAGLEQGRNLTPLGGSAFDLDATGAVVVLDEANRRLLRFRNSRAPEHVPLTINGTLADLAIGDDGAIHVLETTSAGEKGLLLRTFARDGQTVGTSAVAEEFASQVRVGPDGPVVFQNESGQWMSVADRGRSLSASAQVASGRSGRPLPEGGEVVVLRTGNEIRLALVDTAGVRRAWRLHSNTTVAEVQLAEPYGAGLLVVARVYTEQHDEFLVLVLDRSGVAQKFSLAPADWAETAPLSRFRLVGSSVFQLGSTPAGLFVDRFDLEVQ